jgi:rhodanese-related sulfurtransferase
MNVTMTTRLSAFALFLAVCVLFGCEHSVSDKTIEFISTDQVRQYMDKLDRKPHRMVLIDPRAPEDFAAAHLPGARNVQPPAIKPNRRRDPELKRFKYLVVYGENPSSTLARAMAKRLLKAGYSGVRMYLGGLEQWAEAGYEIIREPPPSQD